MEKIAKPWKLLKAWGCLLSLLLLTQAGALAQPAPNQLKSLSVELWPEYDRPETLVIYRAELAPSTALPAQVTFGLPGYLEKMHVVAVEREGILVEVSHDAIELRKEGEQLWLSFSTPVPKIQFEYYDPVILAKQAQTRQLTFDFSPVNEIEKLTVQVQEPFQAEDFSMEPAAAATFTGNDGLKYHLIEIAGLAPNEALTVTARYSRRSELLSARGLGGENAEHAADLAVSQETPANENLALGYTLIGIGVALLLGVAGYWWWSRQSAARPPAATRQPQRQKRRAATAKPAGLSGNFCYRCGTALREAANFCHECGAERRKG